MNNLFEQRRQHTEEDVRFAMLQEDVSDPKIHKAYHTHYSAVGWLDGVGRHVFNIQAHIRKLKANGFLDLIRKNEVPPDPKPSSQIRSCSEPVKLGNIATFEQKREINIAQARKGNTAIQRILEKQGVDWKEAELKK